jgi:hypothetical protein
MKSSPLSIALSLFSLALPAALASMSASSVARAADTHAPKASEARGKKSDTKIAKPLHAPLPARAPVAAIAHAPPSTPARPRVPAQTPCAKAPVDIVSGADADRFVLTQCDGTPAKGAVEHLSIVARPGGVPKPAQPIVELAAQQGPSVAPGIKRVDPGLLSRLQKTVDHFAKSRADGQSARILLVSGYRPTSAGSYHQAAKALDFRIDGVKNEALVAFCKTLDDTGCGYYPNSVFIHMDVRAGAGHVSWIDASGPGESPRYVTSWPPPARTAAESDRAQAKTALSKLERDLPTLPGPDEHPARPRAVPDAPKENDSRDATKAPAKDPDPDTIPAGPMDEAQ